MCELLIGEIWKEFLKVDSVYDWPVSQKGDRFLSLVALVNHIKGAEDYLQRRKNCFSKKSASWSPRTPQLSGTSPPVPKTLLNYA